MSSYHGRTSTRSRLEFRILGPLEVRRGERALPLGGPKQRALLAVLLLHANVRVPRERLIEELWGDAAPPTVNAVLNNYLTKLRRLLASGDGDGVLTTQAHGYVLHTDTNGLDAARFEQLIDEARAALARGEAEDAAATFREALALWRGPALADFAYEQFAQREIRRLEELRLAALEDRIDADLALRRHETLVAELEALVAEHAYRERMQAQLMLALYRSGRQAEALDAYGRARRTLVDELGIEPAPRLQDLERAILRHDNSLEPPVAPAPVDHELKTTRTAPRARVRWTLAVAIGLAVVLALSVALAATSDDTPVSSAKPIALMGDSLAVVDPTRASVVAEVPLGGRPSGIAVGGGLVWVGNRDDNTLLGIDPRTRSIARTIGLPSAPGDVVTAAGSLWVGSGNTVLRVDPDVNDVVVIRLGGTVLQCCGNDVEVGRSVVWASHRGALSRIDPSTNAVQRVRDAGVQSIAYGHETLWALTEANRLERLDPGTNRVVDSISLEHVGQITFGGVVAAGANAVWAAPTSGKTLWRIDPLSDQFAGSVPVGCAPAGLALGGRAVWVACKDRTIVRVDPKSERVAKPVQLGVYPAPSDAPIAVGEGAVWVAVTR